MKKKYMALAAAGLVFIAGCGGSSVTYTDGTYEGKSGEFINEEDADAGSGYGVVQITVSSGAITDCRFTTYELDGTLKDTEYGKKEGSIANKDFYNKAQKAVAACDKYAEELVLSGDVNMVDAISGATYNYEQFVDAVNAALAQAEQK